ncbi:MAG TPA: Arm DNA-binding domain-containing protein, partial [Verrucomicrobiae bacterium]|nr:Arm DNA-binding domain-containing protein [Verrucomicrobiae bacterium]
MRSPERGQRTYFDDALPGFGVRVSQGGTKSFIVLVGKTRRRQTLGKFPDVSLADARKAAKKIIGDAAIRQPDALIPSKISFDEARDRFLADSEERTKPKTYEEYLRLLHRHFSFDVELANLTRAKVMGALDNIS